MQKTQRIRTFKFVAAAASATFVASMIAVVAQPAGAATTNHAVSTSGETFTPGVLTDVVAVGDTITFSGLSGHNATSTAGSAASFASTAGAPTFVYTPTVAGKYTYECTFHGGMTGSFTVVAAGAAPAAGAPATPAAGAPAAGAPAAPAAGAPAAPVDPAAAPAAGAPAAGAPAAPAAGAPAAGGGDDDEGDDDGDHHGGDDGDDD